MNITKAHPGQQAYTQLPIDKRFVRYVPVTILKVFKRSVRVRFRNNRQKTVEAKMCEVF